MILRDFVFSLLGKLPSKLSSAIIFRYRLGRWPKSKGVLSFSDHLHLYKQADSFSKMPQFVDKVAVKALIREIIGDGWVIPTLYWGGELPPRSKRTWKPPYVIKANHGSGTNIFVRSEQDAKWGEIDKEISRWLRHGHPTAYNEWPYRAIKPMVLVEPMISTVPPKDYKLFVFGGKVAFIQVDTDRFTVHKRVFFDQEWQRLPFELEFPLEEDEVERPLNLRRMIEAAEKIAKQFPFARVDFYEVDQKPYFGEVTFFPGSGVERFRPSDWDFEIGRRWPSDHNRRHLNDIGA